MTTPNQTQVTDEQLEDQISTLNKKAQKTEEEGKQLSELKEEKQTRYQKRIDHLSWEAKSAKEEAENERQRVKELEEELEKAKQPKEPVRVVKETVTIGDKAFFTDASLISKVRAGDMTEEEAFAHQEQRREEAAAEKAYQRVKAEREKEIFETKLIADKEKVMREYPHFNKNDKNFNPEDPLYKEANEIYINGYYVLPDGMSKAIEKAKKIVGQSDQRADRTEDFSLHSPSSPDPKTENNKPVPLTDYERESAIRMFRDTINPRTNRTYTESEAIAKAQQAKERRMK